MYNHNLVSEHSTKILHTLLKNNYMYVQICFVELLNLDKLYIPGIIALVVSSLFLILCWHVLIMIVNWLFKDKINDFFYSLNYNIKIAMFLKNFHILYK